MPESHIFIVSQFRRFLPLWNLGGSLGAATLVGIGAFKIQQHELLPSFFYPLLFPLFIGAVAGVLNVRIAGGKPYSSGQLLVRALSCGFVVFATELICGYLAYRHDIHVAAARNSHFALIRAQSDLMEPVGLLAFLSAQASRGSLWFVCDALLTLIGATFGSWICQPASHDPSTLFSTSTPYPRS